MTEDDRPESAEVPGETGERAGTAVDTEAAESAEPTAASKATADDGESASQGREWHGAPAEEVVEAVGSSPDGLTGDEAARRLRDHGENAIRDDAGVSPLRLFASQFQDVLVYLLFAAAALSVAVGFLPGSSPDYTDAALILVILLANGVFGFVQDYRAERSIEALRELSAPDATVLRDGEPLTVDAVAVVPGDVLLLEQGDAVPADARLLHASELRTDESTLTGESTPVSKDAAAVAADATLAERSSMVYSGTTVVGGRGRAVVVATGMDTRVGGIAEQLRTVEEPETPFQTEIDRLGRQIGLGVVALVAVVSAVEFLFTATNPLSVLLVGVTLAVAAVPEGLPAVVTLTLALGSRRLVAQNALVRRLPVVESLGSVDVIVTDKTGTLTENRMTVTRAYASGERVAVTGSGTDAEGGFRRDGAPVDAAALEPLLRCGAVCNNASRVRGDAGRDYRGDPTEIALLVSAAKADVSAAHDRLREVPFSSTRKRMTVVADGETPTAYTKGAPEVVLERCDRVLVDGEAVPLTDERRAAIREATDDFAADALRVLGFAFREGVDPDADVDALERGLVFLGLQGMIDPPREEVPAAVEDCRRAGVGVVMATGDNVETAKAVGGQIGFDPDGALTGRELDALSDDELAEAVEAVEVFARVDPEHKVRLLRALQGNAHRVAMTGDGVNDAPALRNADVGVSMGIRGTDVAKQASDVVLQDDNFATIRTAIAEGRGVFDNTRKFVNYLLSANTGEVLVVFVGVLLGTFLFPDRFAVRGEALILTPVMLLWINLVTDGLPALALGVDPKAEGLLDRPPRDRDEPVIDRRLAASIAAIGAVMTATGLALFFRTLVASDSIVEAQSILFTFLVVVEVVRLQVIRSRYHLSLASNPWLLGALAVTLALQLAVLYTPLSAVFAVHQPGLPEWGWIAAGFVAFLALNLGTNLLFDRVFGDEV